MTNRSVKLWNKHKVQFADSSKAINFEDRQNEDCSTFSVHSQLFVLFYRFNARGFSMRILLFRQPSPWNLTVDGSLSCHVDISAPRMNFRQKRHPTKKKDDMSSRAGASTEKQERYRVCTGAALLKYNYGRYPDEAARHCKYTRLLKFNLVVCLAGQLSS